MSRISRIAFLAALAIALAVVAGFDLRLALASRDLAIETTVALDAHERRLNGTSAVTNSILDEHERRATAIAPSTVASGTSATLDEHERRALRQAVSVGSSVPAALDEHERRATSR